MHTFLIYDPVTGGTIATFGQFTAEELPFMLRVLASYNRQTAADPSARQCLTIASDTRHGTQRGGEKIETA